MSPADDEKICPYCAETIKKAAIKCRYCHSDLAGEEGRTSPTSSTGLSPGYTTDPAFATPHTDRRKRQHPSHPSGASKHSRAESTRGRSGLGGAGILASPLLSLLLALAALVLLLGCYWAYARRGSSGVSADGQVTDPTRRAIAVSEASSLVESTLSYSYKSFDADRSRKLAMLTPSFARKYTRVLDQVAAKTKADQVTLVAQVRAAGLVSLGEHDAKVLVFLNQTTTSGVTPNAQPQIDQNRLLVTLTRASGDWHLADIDPLRSRPAPSGNSEK